MDIEIFAKVVVADGEIVQGMDIISDKVDRKSDLRVAYMIAWKFTNSNRKFKMEQI